MSKLKKQFSELRQNTPKRVQWLLLGVAFVLVIILLTLLIGGKKNKNSAELMELMDSASTDLIISPDMLNWSGVIVGEEKSGEIKISATAPVKILAVRLHHEVPGFNVTRTCEKQATVNQTVACRLFLTYKPTAAQDVTQFPIEIQWHDVNAGEEMSHVSKIAISLGAKMPEVKETPKVEPAKPAVIKATEEPEIEEIEEVEEEYEAPTIKQEIKKEIEVIAPAIDVEPQPVATSPVESYEIPDGCSDFAFPGYGTNGRQIGWIKPSGGSYYFHPFSDTDCSEATGIYNPDNGIITDIDKPGKKIGTDADHIGYVAVSGGVLPQLSNAPAVKQEYRARQLNVEAEELPKMGGAARIGADSESSFGGLRNAIKEDVTFGTTGDAVISTQPYDRSFVLRQFKPIPATIVSDVRADIEMLKSEGSLPVRATVDRNVYSDNGRTVVIPAGTLLMGYVTGEIPGPYKTIGRMEIKWYQFILPNGVEFNFDSQQDPFSADAQGRVGVPGRGSSDYLEQFVMPMLTAFVPATINLINPIADAFVNQIDLDNNTVVQSGTMRSSELAKNEIITAWNSVAQKLLVDMMDNTVPPFTIPAGTRITVYSPVDLQVACTTNEDCIISANDEHKQNNKRRDWGKDVNSANVEAADDDSWIGQARSWMAAGAKQYCYLDDNGLYRVKAECSGAGGKNVCDGYSYSTLKMWCDSLNYESKKAKQYEAYTEDQKKQYQNKVEELGGVGSQQYNEEILGVKYDDNGAVVNPYASEPKEQAPAENVMTCLDGSLPDENGCCAGEIYTDMGEQGFNCCPEGGGDCFPPII